MYILYRHVLNSWTGIHLSHHSQYTPAFHTTLRHTKQPQCILSNNMCYLERIEFLLFSFSILLKIKPFSFRTALGMLFCLVLFPFCSLLTMAPGYTNIENRKGNKHIYKLAQKRELYYVYTQTWRTAQTVVKVSVWTTALEF